MSVQEEFLVKNECSDNSYYQDYKDEEKTDINQLNESSGELTTIKNLNGDNIPVYLRLGKRILFCSGKYFYIERTTDQMAGIITTCHTCGVRIRGSLKISSNFITHLKARHPEVYKDFLKEKQAAGTWTTSKRFSQRTSPYPSNVPVGGNILQHQENQEIFHHNVLQFIIATNQPLSLIEDANFRKLFEFLDFSVSLKTSFQYEEMIKDYCKYKQLQISNMFNSSEQKICLTWDAWSLGKCKYIAVSGHWIDGQYQRQTAVLACIRSAISERNCLQTLLNDVMLRYGLQKEYIVETVTENIQNYTRDFVEFGVNSETLCFDYTVQNEDDFLLNQMEGNLELLNINKEAEIKVSQLDILRLNKIWGGRFTSNLDFKTTDLHRTCMEKCSLIWKDCLRTRFKEYFANILSDPITPPNLFCFSSLYKSLKQLHLNKNQLPHICVFLKSPNFSDSELEYLEELVDVFEPLYAAFEFLDMPQNHLYGCFLPTLVTIKWKLTRLHNSKKLKHLQESLIKLKEQLLTEFQLYYELNDAKSEAILAAITYPPVKTRFLTGLQDSISSINFEARNFLLKYGKDYHVDDAEQGDANTMLIKPENTMLTTTPLTNFFDFGDNAENIAGEYMAPISLKLEIDNYLADNDIALTSLHKYPTIKRMFFRYNTCIPSPSSVIRLLPLQKILRTSLLTSCTHEQFEDYIFYQCHLLNK